MPSLPNISTVSAERLWPRTQPSRKLVLNSFSSAGVAISAIGRWLCASTGPAARQAASVVIMNFFIVCSFLVVVDRRNAGPLLPGSLPGIPLRLSAPPCGEGLRDGGDQ